MHHGLQLLNNPHALLTLATPYAIRAVTALLIFIIGRWILRLLVKLMNRAMTRAGSDPTLMNFVNRLVTIVGLTLIIIAALSRLGVNTTSASAILGGSAIAIGLSLQSQLASFAAGVLLVIFRPIRVGEWVEVDGKSGSVTEIHMFYTALTSFGNQLVVIPNRLVWGSAIINYGRNPWRRIVLSVSVGYDADLRKVKALLQELTTDDERILKDPPATLGVCGLKDSTVEFTVRVCANSSDWWALQCDLLERIKTRFEAAGIARPNTQMDMHVKALPNPGRQAA